MRGWFLSKGVLRYSLPNGIHKVALEADPDIVGLARALTPVRLNTQRYAPHVSVVRHEVPPNLEAWGKHEGTTILFEYSPVVYNDETYYWLQVLSQELRQVRLELGLNPSGKSSRPPDGAEVFHITIGNIKKIA